MGKKTDLNKSYWNPKRKMWVTGYFSEINNYSKKGLKCRTVYSILFSNLRTFVLIVSAHPNCAHNSLFS